MGTIVGYLRSTGVRISGISESCNKSDGEEDLIEHCLSTT